MRKISYRKDFIDYVLYHYDFEDRVAVWILNFLKSHPVVSKNVFFTPDILHRRRLRIAAVGTNRPTLVFEKGDTVTSDGEVIFHELNMNQDELLYLEFAFPAQDARYREVKKIENDLDKELQTIADDALLKEIDHALDKHDQELFQRLVKMLKRST